MKSTHKILTRVESYVVVWGKGAAVLTWKTNGLSAEHQPYEAQSGTSSLYVPTRQWLLPWFEDIIGSTTTWPYLDKNPMSYSCAKIVTTQLLGFEGIECSDTLLIILRHIDDRLAEIMFNEIELQLAVHCKEFSIEGEVYIEGEVLGSYVLPVSSLEQ